MTGPAPLPVLRSAAAVRERADEVRAALRATNRGVPSRPSPRAKHRCDPALRRARPPPPRAVGWFDRPPGLLSQERRSSAIRLPASRERSAAIVSVRAADGSSSPVTSSPSKSTWSCQTSRRQGCNGTGASAAARSSRPTNGAEFSNAVTIRSATAASADSSSLSPWTRATRLP